MLRHSTKDRILSRVAFYGAVVALLWALEKADGLKQQPAPMGHPLINFVALNQGR